MRAAQITMQDSPRARPASDRHQQNRLRRTKSQFQASLPERTR